VLDHNSSNISETRKELKIEEKLLWRAYRKSQTRSFKRYHCRPLRCDWSGLQFATRTQNSSHYYLRNG